MTHPPRPRRFPWSSLDRSFPLPRPRPVALLCCGLLLPVAATAAEVFRQDFNGSFNLADYVHATAPTAGQFNDISAEADGGKWIIGPNRQLQLTRAGFPLPNNGAGFTRHTGIAGPAGLLHAQFDFGAYMNTAQGDAVTIDFGAFTGVTDYNGSSVANNVFLRLAIDGAGTGSNAFRFEISGAQSANYVANGAMYHVQVFMNKSGAAASYRGPDGQPHALDHGRASVWVDNVVLFDNVAATNGGNSALTGMRARFGGADAGTYRFDNFIFDRELPAMGWGRIRIHPNMLTNEVASGEVTRLIDEQEVHGVPLVTSPTGPLPTYNWGQLAHPVTKFQAPINGQNSWHYPLNAVIDLGADHELTHVCLHDSNGSGDVTVYAGTPFDWTPLFPTYGQTGYNTWLRQPVSVTTRFLRVSIAGNGAIPNEIILYGTQVGAAGAPPTPVLHQQQATMDQFMGANTIGAVPLHRMQAVGTLREYRQWAYAEGHTGYASYLGYPDNQNGFAPAWTGANYDTIYANRKMFGLETLTCVQGSVRWLTSSFNDKPIDPTFDPPLDPEEPASYIEHADHLFQTVARYGSEPVADSLLKLRPNNARLSGLGLMNYIENWNEQTAWWMSRSAYFKPYEYAAMSSADADGHFGAMGLDKGVWNADPNVRFIMGGLAEDDIRYIQALRFWSDYNRGGDFPWDAINIHHYSNTGGGQYAGAIGVSPEDDHFKDRMRVFREYRDRYLPGVEFWMSEFGYDTNTESKQRAPSIGTFSQQEVQAQWLVRSFLELAAAGVDRAQMFTLADDAAPGVGGQYGNCGLTTWQWDGCKPKISWWYIYTMKNRLAGLRFEGEQISGNHNVRVYRFKNAAGAIRAYAVWCPTSNQTEVNGYQLSLQGAVSTAHLVTMQEGDPDGIKTPLAINSGKVSIDVSERPVFVLINHTTPDYEITQKLTLTPSMVVHESGPGDSSKMVDEQEISGEPRDPGPTDRPKPSTTVSGANAWYYTNNVPAVAYIDLGQVRQIDRICVFDLGSAGNLTIEKGSPTAGWTVIKVDPLGGYNSWNHHLFKPEDTATRYLRFTKAHAGANFGEVVIYGK